MFECKVIALSTKGKMFCRFFLISCATNCTIAFERSFTDYFCLFPLFYYLLCVI